MRTHSLPFRRTAISLTAMLALVVVPGTADAAPGGEQEQKRGSKQGQKQAQQKQARSGPAKAKLQLRLTGPAKRGSSQIMNLVKVRGNLAPFVARQKVEVDFFRNGRRVRTKQVKVRKGDGNFGVFDAAIQPRRPGKWAAAVRHKPNRMQRGAFTKRKSWRLSFPGIEPGQCGPEVLGFMRALRKMGYITNGGRCLKGRTMRGVLAYRKVNDMTRNFVASADLVEDVYRGQGGYKVRYPETRGVHIEAPLSKQVLVFADGKKPVAIYPVSSGKSSTPTVTGTYEMDWTQPGYNELGMYYSWYFYRGYAVHGYKSVPNYPASNGCFRTFEADQPEIFNRISRGDVIHIW